MSGITKAGTFIGKKILANRFVQWPTALTIGGITAYSIVNDGLDRGRQYANEQMAKDYLDLFAKTQTAPHESNLLERMKIGARDILFNNKIYPAYTKTKNAIGGLLAETASNSLNVAAVAGFFTGLFSKSNSKFMKTILPAVSTAYLLLSAGKTLAVDVLGIGKKDM